MSLPVTKRALDCLQALAVTLERFPRWQRTCSLSNTSLSLHQKEFLGILSKICTVSPEYSTSDLARSEEKHTLLQSLLLPKQTQSQLDLLVLILGGLCSVLSCGGGLSHSSTVSPQSGWTACLLPPTAKVRCSLSVSVIHSQASRQNLSCRDIDTCIVSIAGRVRYVLLGVCVCSVVMQDTEKCLDHCRLRNSSDVRLQSLPFDTRCSRCKTEDRSPLLRWVQMQSRRRIRTLWRL